MEPSTIPATRVEVEPPAPPPIADMDPELSLNTTTNAPRSFDHEVDEADLGVETEEFNEKGTEPGGEQLGIVESALQYWNNLSFSDQAGTVLGTALFTYSALTGNVLGAATALGLVVLHAGGYITRAFKSLEGQEEE